MSFSNIRTPGAFLVSASRASSGELSGVSILSEVGGLCKLAVSGSLLKHKPSVKTAAGVAVVVGCEYAAEGYCAFKTAAQTTYAVMF